MNLPDIRETVLFGFAFLGQAGLRLLILIFLLLAVWTVRQLSWPLARRIVRLSRFAHREREYRPERQRTLQGLVADSLGGLSILVAFLVGLVYLVGVSADTVFWTLGLLSAGFGLGARPLISDFLAGASFVFEDTFSVGEKVHIGEIEGVIEAVNIRTTHVRSPSGELCIVPNGEIRVMRNYTRGRFSTADITLNVPASDLRQALPVLEALGVEIAGEIDELIGPWQVISKGGVLGPQAELTLVAKAKFGAGAELRPKLLALVHERLAREGIEAG